MGSYRKELRYEREMRDGYEIEHSRCAASDVSSGRSFDGNVEALCLFESER